MVTEAEFKPVRAWAGVAVLIIFSLMSYIDRQIISLLVDPIKNDLLLSDIQISLVQGLAFAIFYSIAGLPIGMAADRYSRRLILFLGVLVFSVASASCGLADSFEDLFLGRVAVGVGEAVITPVALSIISGTFPRDRLATAMGVYGVAVYVGQGASLGVGGLVIGALSHLPQVHLPLMGATTPWQATFILTALPGVVLSILAFTLMDRRGDTSRSITPSAGGYGVVFRGRGVVLTYFLAGFAMLGMISYVTLAWTPAFFMRQHQWSPQQIGLTLGLIVAVVGTGGSLGFGRFLSWLAGRGHSSAYFVVPAVTCLISVPLFTAAYLIKDPWFTLILIALGYLMLSSTGPASYTAMQLIVPEQMRGRIAAVYVLTLSMFAAALGPLSVAIITDYILMDEARVGESIALVMVVVVPCACLILFRGRRALIEALDPDTEPHS